MSMFNRVRRCRCSCSSADSRASRPAPPWRGAPPRRPPPTPGRRPRPSISTPSLFPRLVLCWINADFRVQIRIFQHFSSSARKSSSRKQICKIFAKFHGILQFFLDIFRNFQKISSKFAQVCNFFTKFADFFAEFCKIL